MRYFLREAAQAVLGLTLIAGSLAAAGIIYIGNVREHPLIMAVSALGSIGSLAALLWLLFQRDLLPDFLRKISRHCHEKEGLCFLVTGVTIDGVYHLTIFHQNRYERDCVGEVILKPPHGLLLNQRAVESLRIGILCPGGAFGVTHLPWPVPESWQGKKVSMEIAALVNYPQSRGRMMRFRDGLKVGETTESMSISPLTALTAIGGTLIINRAAKVKFILPMGVATDIPDDAPIITRTLWKPGDREEGVLEQFGLQLQGVVPNR